MLNIGSISDTFSSTTAGAMIDVTPDPFIFTNQDNVAPGTIVTSNTVTISGITAAVPITVSGGEYSVNGGAYSAAGGTVNNGDTVTVRHTSSAGYNTTVETELTVGGVSDTFSSTTMVGDSTPDFFTFTGQRDVAPNAAVTSNAITVSGVNVATDIYVSDGEYSINGDAYTAAPGTVVNGDTVTVRHTSSAGYNTTVNTVLTIGGVSDTFSSTTESAPTAASDSGGGGGGAFGPWLLAVLLGSFLRRRKA